MVKRGVLVGLVCLMVLALGTAAWAGPILDRVVKNKVLVVGTNAAYPPFTVKDKNGKVIGLDMDIARGLAKTMGVKLQIKTMPFPDLLKAVAAGKVDLGMAGITMTPARNTKMNFAGPYFITGQGAVLKAKVAASLGDPKNMNSPGFTMAVAKGTTGEMAAKKLFPKATILVEPTMDAAFKALANDKAKALVADFPYCALTVFRHQEIKLAALDKPFSFEPLGIAVPPGDADLLNLVDNFVGTLEGSGTLEKIRAFWFKNAAWMKNVPK